MALKNEKLLRKLEEIKIEMKYGPYIHGVDLTSNMDEMTNTLLVAKEINVIYIYDLNGITGMYWNPKGRYISNQNIENEDDVYMFITGMTKEQYKNKLALTRAYDSIKR